MTPTTTDAGSRSSAPVTAARLLTLGGAITFAALFTGRAIDPVDATLLPIAVALIAVTAAVVAGYRLAGWLYLAFPIALFTSPAIRELAFNLSAVDSVAWRWYSVVSLVSLGLATAGAILVGRHGRHGRRRPAAEAVASPDRSGDVGPVWLAAGGGGLVLGLAFLLLAPAVAGNPGFGRELSDDELAALPTIDLLNYRYDPGVVSVDASGITRFRLENPTDVPHTVTIDAIDLEVWVPARRWSVIEFDAGELSERLAFYCSVGDHRQLGMSGVLQVGA